MSGTEAALEKKVQRQFGMALVFSLLILIGGMAWTWRIGKESNLTFHRLSHIREDLDAMKATLAREASTR